jgi:hypothetical protein
VTDSPAAPLYRNETGVAEWLVAFWFGMIAAAVAWFYGAGWWSLIALPLCIGLTLVSMLLRARPHSS